MPAARRGFLKAVATLPLAPAVLAAAPAVPPAPAPVADAPASEAVAEALAEAVRREHAAHLDASALAEVRKQIARSLERATRLRAAARLINADPPVTTFSPLPPSEGERSRP